MTQPNHPTPMSMPGAQQAAAAAQGQQPPAAPAAPAPAAPAPVAAPAPNSPPQLPEGGQQQQPPNAPQPPWGSDEEFDPQRAWKLIQNVRGDNETLKQQLADAQPILDEHERLRQASLNDNERLTEQLSQSAGREETWRNQAIRSAVEAKIAGRFVDNDTVMTLLGDLSGFVDGDAIATDRITTALDQLAANKPFLVAQPGPQGFTPNPAQGQSGAAPSAAIDAQIQAAQDRGDFATSIALKQQKLLSQQQS